MILSWRGDGGMSESEFGEEIRVGKVSARRGAGGGSRRGGDGVVERRFMVQKVGEGVPASVGDAPASCGPASEVVVRPRRGHVHIVLHLQVFPSRSPRSQR